MRPATGPLLRWLHRAHRRAQPGRTLISVAAVAIGVASGLICYFAVALKNRLGWDDALDVWGVHGVGGLIGIILLGVFGQKFINPTGFDGLLYGDTTGFFWKQLGAVAISSVYAFAFTYAMLLAINLFSRVRVEPGDEEEGLDHRLHGEAAYV